MATTTPDLQELQPKRAGDPSPDEPVQGDPKQRQEQAGLSDDDKKQLLDVVKRYKQMWSSQRRIVVRNTLRRIEYVKGNQYISFDPYSFSFFDPFDTATPGSQQGEDEANVYHYVTNIVQWLLRVFVASLSASMPRTRFWPSNAESDLDNRAAQAASRANALIERQNKAKAMLKQQLAYLGVSGSYFRYSRYVRDSRISGGNQEQYPNEEMQEREVMPDRFTCPACGQDTPADATVAQEQPQCASCGNQMGGSDFYPAMKLPMPVVTGNQEAPNGQVRQSIYNALHVMCAPYVDFDGSDPLINTPILNLGCEIDIAALRAMYPDAWDILKGNASGDMAGQPDGDIDRMARLRSTIPSTSQGAGFLTSGLMTSAQLPTYDRTWIQPQAFNILEDRATAERLKELYPKGCCLASIGGNFLDVRESCLTDEWTWCGTSAGYGAYPPAVLDPAMDFQDRLNDADNTTHEYYDRMACPPILYDSKMIGEGFNGKFLPPGVLIKAPANTEMGRSLKDAFWQPTFTIDKSIHQYRESLLMGAQLLSGVTPQMYGGTQPGIETASGQDQALKVASGIMWLYWDQVREECASAAKLSVKCLALNATEEVYDVVEGDDGDFKNEPVDLSDIQGEFNCYPEADQGYPVGFDQMRELLQNMLIEGEKNVLIQEMFQPLKNRRLVAKYLAPMDMEIPGEIERYKVLRDIALLLEQQPIDGADPMTGQPVKLPSVLPDKDFDDLEITQETVKEYGEKNYKVARENPAAFENLRLYLRLAAQYSAEKQAQQAMPAGPPQPGGPPQPPGPPS